jgi:hypothetical protein
MQVIVLHLTEQHLEDDEEGGEVGTAEGTTIAALVPLLLSLTPEDDV